MVYGKKMTDQNYFNYYLAKIKGTSLITLTEYSKIIAKV